jgi:hypothetical protein
MVGDRKYKTAVDYAEVTMGEHANLHLLEKALVDLLTKRQACRLSWLGDPVRDRQHYP